MNKLLEELSLCMMSAFAQAGYDEDLGRVSVSNRPDLCEYQCNGAMAGAKRFHKAPIQIANDVAEVINNRIDDSKTTGDKYPFSRVEAVAPGFLNLDLSNEYLSGYITSMSKDEHLGIDMPEAETVIIDYGGPNVAKPLHVGHLRSAVIGESIKRIYRYMGNNVIGDIHMGDWGLQMGLVIYELSLRQPDLPYFDEAFEGEYPQEAPFTVRDLEEIYPTASGKSKEDEEYKAHAMEATHKLQMGVRGYRALWDHIMKVSVADLKRNYNRLLVDFDLWKGESDVQVLIPEMVQDMKDGGYAYYSEGALVVDVKEETDTKEMPPCMILKSDGASLYNTTDLATLKDRMQNYAPSKVIYLTDKRQELYFEQVFRCARKTGIVPDSTELIHIGFGTVNGLDGKPYKTRTGGVPRLEDLIDEIEQAMLVKIEENAATKGDALTKDEAIERARKVGLAAIKYGDLSNQAAKDYIFDPEKFTSFEGDTGPYILYTAVRINSILRKFKEQGGDIDACVIKPAQNASEKALMKAISNFNGEMLSAYEDCAPHKLCAYIYELSNAFNSFYHENHILTQEDNDRKNSFISQIVLTGRILETCAKVLGFEIPERM